MVKVIASSVRKGNVLDLDGKLAVVMHAENIHPGKGTPVTHLEMRRIADGVKVTERYRTTDQVERAYLDEKDFNYLYEDDMGYNFMHPETFDQIMLNREILGDAIKYMRENDTIDLLSYKDEPLSVELPASVNLMVTRTDPGFKGDTATGGTKPATVETGLVVNVPLFVNEGDVIKVNTNTGEYLTRV